MCVCVCVLLFHYSTICSIWDLELFHGNHSSEVIKSRRKNIHQITSTIIFSFIWYFQVEIPPDEDIKSQSKALISQVRELVTKAKEGQMIIGITILHLCMSLSQVVEVAWAWLTAGCYQTDVEEVAVAFILKIFNKKADHMATIRLFLV